MASFEGEIDLLILPGVSVVGPSGEVHATLKLTNVRLLFLANAHAFAPTDLQLPLFLYASHAAKSSLFHKHPLITFHFNQPPAPPAPSAKPSTAPVPAFTAQMQTSCSRLCPTFTVTIADKPQSKALDAAISNALRHRAWLSVGATIPTVPKPASFSARHAGVAGIVRKQTEAAQAAKSQMSAAFSDLDGLMKHARDMVALARTVESKLAAQESALKSPGSVAASASGDAGDGLSTTEAAEFRSMMQAVGVASPVTRALAAGGETSVYFRELAAQFSSFMSRVLAVSSGHLLTLPEAYCLYNRARGTDLVSPDDIVACLPLLDQLGLPVVVETLPSGVRLLAPRPAGGRTIAEAVADQIKQLSAKLALQQGIPLSEVRLTAAVVSEAFKVSLALSSSQLAVAEAAGALCRDVGGVEGLVLYPNVFGNWVE
jgi:hypothetical protein